VADDALRREILGFDPAVPIERASMPPASWYTSQELFALERAFVLGSSWQPVVRADEVGRPGSHASGRLCGEPWVVTRDQAGRLRAFANVCLHKGREVVQGAGGATELVCGYHAWAYGLDGRLKRAPRIAGIEAFDRDAMALKPLALEVWGPWVWIHGDPDARPVAAGVAELDRRLRATGWDRLRFVSRKSWPIACNWKVYVDNYLDGGYHIPHMHPTLDAQLDMGTYRTEIFDAFSIQTSEPARAKDERLDYDARARIGPGAIYAWLHPNFMLNRYGPCLDTNHVIPHGPDRCEVVYEFYFDETALPSDAAGDFIRRSIEQSDVTQREDVAICESVQVGMRSRAYRPGRYAPRVETGEHHFHRLLAQDLRRGLETTGR